jgi:hypothetical protein
MAIAGTEYTPTAPARIGRMTRNPLPKIYESGVMVALIRFEDLSAFILTPVSTSEHAWPI